MAELVQLRLEHGLKELEEMERIKLFNKDEISKISKKRKMYEYRLRRRKRCKEDFLQYIEFEICLLLLISKRRDRLLVESKKKEIDNSIAKKINRLFKAVISRYPDDEKLWLNQIEYFKRMKWNDSINALYTKLLQVHSRKPDLWIMAAKWEIEENHSYDNARGILQRGVVINPKSEILWREYFWMELKYLELIRKRKQVLQLSDTKDASEGNDAVLRGDIIIVVFDKAYKEIYDFDFALSLMKICFEFDFGEKFYKYILSVVERDFPDIEEVVDATVKLPLLCIQERFERERKYKKDVSLSEVRKMIFKDMCLHYDRSVTRIPTVKMWNLYLEFLYKKLETCNSESSKTKIETLIINKMAEASELQCLDMHYYVSWSQLLIKRGEMENAIYVSTNAAYKWKTASHWIDCLMCHIICKKPKDVIYNRIIEALDSLNEKESFRVWKFGIDILTINNPERLMELYEKGITKGEEISSPIKEMYLESVALRNGIEAARNLYERFKKMGSLSSNIHCEMIKIERAQVKPSLRHIRACFERMIEECGHMNVDVWLEFLQFEAKYARDPESFNLLQWKCLKTLQPHLVDEFQTRITKLLTGSQVFTDNDLAALDS